MINELIERIVNTVTNLSLRVDRLERQEPVQGVSGGTEWKEPGTLSDTSTNADGPPHTHEIDSSIARQADLQALAADLQALADDAVLYTPQSESVARQNQAQDNLRLMDAITGGHHLQKTLVPSGELVVIGPHRQILVAGEMSVEIGGVIDVEPDGELVVI